MRDLRISSEEFRNFVWPAVGFQSVENGGEVDAHVRLLGKLKPVSTPINPDERGISGRQLDTEEIQLSLEEDEYGRLKKALQGIVTDVPGGQLDGFKELQDRLDEVEQYEAEASE